MSSHAQGEGWLEQIRGYDLNDYALGLSISNSQNPYEGAENGTFFYPYLTSFQDSAMTEDWLLIREGNVGIRVVSDNAWEFGLLARINTLGPGNNESAELDQLRARDWTMEVAPMIGYRGWPVHLNFKSHVDILGRHNSLSHSLSFTWPLQFSRGYLVPGVELVHANSDYNRYYFDVHPDEVTPTREAYTTGATTNTHLKLRWGYALTDKWLLAGSLRMEKLDSAIEASPIVGRSHLWSTDIGLAYNANMFQHRESKSQAADRFELRIGAFRDTIDSKISYGEPGGASGPEIDIEEELQVQDTTTVLHVEGLYRLNHFHRLEFSYLKLKRDSLATLTQSISFGGTEYPAGSVIDSQLEHEIARLSYGYSILRDDQKEFGVSAGIHFAGLETQLKSLTTGETQTANSNTPLPVVGAFGAAHLSARFTVGAKAQFFRMDFDGYEGSVNSVTVYAERELGKHVLFGLSYHYFTMNLESTEPEIAGRVSAKHTGPSVYFSMRI